MYDKLAHFDCFFSNILEDLILGNGRTYKRVGDAVTDDECFGRFPCSNAALLAFASWQA